MSMEGFPKKATPAEIQTAESTMTATQKELSKKREVRLGKLAELGMTGHLSASEERARQDSRLGIPNSTKLEGVLNGRTISFVVHYEKEAGANMPLLAKYEGTVDGKPIKPHDVERAFEKYYSEGIIQGAREGEQIKDAMEEVKDLGYRKMLGDIGLAA